MAILQLLLITLTATNQVNLSLALLIIETFLCFRINRLPLSSPFSITDIKLKYQVLDTNRKIARIEVIIAVL
ncbi:hypothetical protein BDF22DRAFT_163982 [Syncephalis plumigaleata]|nr:hypothetical protein BDF22DRAFT_163982 [Syncephalis plumigaleata]